MDWTFKTLRFGQDGKAEFVTMPFQFPVAALAVSAASAYMLAHAERGHMVVVSLEPTPELKPTMDRLNEHTVMLDYLKAEFKRTGKADLWDLVHAIDPEWPNPWRAGNECVCPFGEISQNCPIHAYKD